MPEIARTTPPKPSRVLIARWFGSVSSMGLVASLALHTCITLVAAIVGVSIAQSVSTGSGDSPVDLSLSGEVRLTELDGGPIIAPNSLVTSAEVADSANDGTLSGPGGIDEPGAGPGLGQIADGIGGAGGGGVGDGLGAGGGSGGGGAKFFGVEARGNRFLYICDTSGSMDTPDAGANKPLKRIDRLKLELNESIRGLLDSSTFYVVFFNSGPQTIQDQRAWITANTAGKRRASDQVNVLAAFGGTEPWPAFEIAFQFKPQPDAIYFMTDGEFNPEVAAMIASANQGPRKVPIHCISFISNAGEEVMRKIAADSGGSYKHVRAGR